MTRRLLAGYLALTIVVLVALELPLAIVNARNERQDLTAKVERDAFAAASLAEDTLHSGARSSALQRLVVGYWTRTGGRIVIVDRTGQSVADSHPTTADERAFGTRPEIRAALGGRTVTGIRASETLHDRLLYVAVPVASAGKVFGAVRITYPTSALDRRVRRYRVALAAVALIVLAAASVVGLLLARSVTRPLRRLEAATERVGRGELDARAPEAEGPPEVRRLAAEVNRTTAKLGALLESQQQFVADASHELRTPLTALRLRLENGDVEAGLVEADRLARVVDELLALTRADTAGEPPVDLELTELVARRLELWGPFAEERGVHLTTVADGRPVRAGVGRVEQVLDNLLSNAIDASPHGATVTVATEETQLHVLDEGPGLTPEQRERAFDRFWREGRGEGSGLGLAIVKRLVEVDGGRVELRAAPTGGVDAVVTYTARA